MKGTPEEKLELSFKVYDINRDGVISPKELFRVMNQMYSTFYNENQSEHIHTIVSHFFDDLDVNGDGQLSFEEYKLQAMKEPLIVDFLEQFCRPPDDDPQTFTNSHPIN
ncbi:hypothetical protein BKA69DRAFT_1099999 [Paraphysoderma sedebokerense]|nr:hypothetical protein BKA69DRAFT_1099999 [Paraphysoderma sedebokerense]